MGPRLFRRGNELPIAAMVHSGGLQWGHVFSDVETILLLAQLLSVNCFNGATSFQTWKRNWMEHLGFRPEALQWGHVFSDVETGPK